MSSASRAPFRGPVRRRRCTHAPHDTDAPAGASRLLVLCAVTIFRRLAEGVPVRIFGMADDKRDMIVFIVAESYLPEATGSEV